MPGSQKTKWLKLDQWTDPNDRIKSNDFNVNYKIIDDNFGKIVTKIEKLEKGIGNVRDPTTGNTAPIDQALCNIYNILSIVNVEDPTTGNIVLIDQALRNIYNMMRIALAFTAKEYDVLSLTAKQYDSRNLTAIQYDAYGKKYLGG